MRRRCSSSFTSNAPSVAAQLWREEDDAPQQGEEAEWWSAPGAAVRVIEARREATQSKTSLAALALKYAVREQTTFAPAAFGAAGEQQQACV